MVTGTVVVWLSPTEVPEAAFASAVFAVWAPWVLQRFPKSGPGSVVEVTEVSRQHERRISCCLQSFGVATPKRRLRRKYVENVGDADMEVRRRLRSD